MVSNETFFEGFIMVEYIEIEFLEWIEHHPYDAENTIIVNSGQKHHTVHSNNVIPTLNKFSAEGWEVVNFTDTFNYLKSENGEGDTSKILQRRKCYLLKRNKE
jgi:hypothetical protein